MLATKPILTWIRRIIGTQQIMRALESRRERGENEDNSNETQRAMNEAVA